MKAYKFKIKRPSKAIVEKFEQTLDLCRELYNAGLQERRDAWKLNRVSISFADQCRQLPEIKSIRQELNGVYSQVLQDTLRRLEKTYKAFFSRIKKGEKAGFPRFKGQNRFDSFTYPQGGFSLTGVNLFLSKIGRVKLFLSRPMQGKMKTLTIKREVSGWFAIFTIETERDILPKTGASIGVDMGIASFATFSDGTQIENNRFYEVNQKKLRVAQRSVARKKKGSKNRKKAVLKLRKLHEKIRNQRNDFHHKVSTHLVGNYDVICIEKLNIKGLSKGRLAKQITDAGIGNFFEMLEYKAESAGRKLIKVPAAYTSQTCYACGHCEKANRTSQCFKCVNCHYVENADINAAKNILSLGMRDLAQSLPLGEFAKESLAI